MTWWNAILPGVMLILGYVGTLWTEERRDIRSLARAKSERAELAKAAQRDRRESFELETLTRAHAALGDFARAVGRAHHVDSMIAKTSGGTDHTSYQRRTPSGSTRLAAPSGPSRD